jgi:hypothetical protein
MTFLKYLTETLALALLMSTVFGLFVLLEAIR